MLVAKMQPVMLNINVIVHLSSLTPVEVVREINNNNNNIKEGCK
jgi:hypothetical protein